MIFGLNNRFFSSSLQHLFAILLPAGFLRVGPTHEFMAEQSTEMSHTQASELLDLLLSHADAISGFDVQALVNLADAAESMGRSEDAEFLLSNISEKESKSGWVGLATAKRYLHKNPQKAMKIISGIIESTEEKINGNSNGKGIDTSSTGEEEVANSDKGECSDSECSHSHEMDGVPDAETSSNTAMLLLQAAALNLRGQLEADSGAPDAARESWALSLAIKAGYGDLFGQANGHHNLPQLAKQQDNLEDALVHATRVVELVADAEDSAWQAHALADLAHLTACDENFDQADIHYRSSLELAEENDDLAAQVVAHWGIADLALIRGDGESALTAYGQALAAHMKLDVPAPEALLQRINALTESQ
jgi:tetratricopeptide (TPR) repeat protein